jgi:Ni/Fe-hydrogenase subunit HybB-like protein
MEHVPTPLNRKYFTPTVMVVLLIALNGLVFLAARFIFGLGAVTNLNDQYPWGIWIGVDVAAGVALAAGGFTSAALGHVMHRDHYHAIIRPALLTAMLGYTFVAIGVAVDLGRYYFIWHPLLMWNGNSALFEVGICVMIYLTVLYVEFMPVVAERLIGKVKIPLFGFLNKPVDTLLRFIDKTLAKTMFIFIIAGVVLSTLHQSSLGTLMIIAGTKMHPLWQTSILPLLFLLSAVAVGFPMIIFESLIASWSLKLEPEMKVLGRLGSLVPPILFIYLAFKLGDLFIRKTFVYLGTFNTQSVMFVIEILLIIIPTIMLLQKKVLKSPIRLFSAAAMVVVGVLVNRINNFIIAYHPPYSPGSYYPSIGELSVTIGFIAIFILIYRFVILNFPVISIERKGEA